ncbi:hypothetical protein HanRHA438_Chr03g0118771 [Helianthus annuus]|nr:hypothetical protein HanRHA438_Chr03g0118771 [Helianthus annuus]
MAKHTRSNAGDSTPTFVAQNLLQNPEREICTFDNVDIAALRSSGAFPDGDIIRPYDRRVRSDVSSSEWLCFLAFPFSIGLMFSLDFIMDFFRVTGLSFSQTMPMVWRIFLVLDRIKTNHIPDLSVEDLPLVYRLRSHGSSWFFLFSTSNSPLILRATRNEDEWKCKFFFIKKDSIPNGGDFPVDWLTKGRI